MMIFFIELDFIFIVLELFFSKLDKGKFLGETGSEERSSPRGTGNKWAARDRIEQEVVNFHRGK